MEFPFNINSSQAPDDVFSLLNNLIASGTANTDEIENADFSGFAPESSLPSFPTRHANAQKPSSVNGEIIGRESEVWNPYSTLPPLSVCPSALTMEEPSSGHIAPQSSTVSATEEENYALDLQPLLMDDLGATDDFCNTYWDQLPLYICDSNEQSNEIVEGVSKNHFMVGQSHQISYPTCVTANEPSSEAIALTNSTVLAIENGQSNSICQPILPYDWQMMMARPLAVPAVGYPPLTSYRPLGLRFCQNDIVHSGPGSSMSIGQLEEYNFMEEYNVMEELKRILKNRGEPHENMNFRYQEVDNGNKRRKTNDGRRRCGCKKTKCIQRYCECFSSGFFCDERCGCKGCNNIIEQRTLVLNKRTEIERRNSLAFAQKIVLLDREDSKLPVIGLSSQKKRHKRGCSCTKTKCLQNYCECYQANVKCSFTCRCKGCGNMDTHEHNAGPTNFMIREAMNNYVNSNRFRRNGGEILPQAEASNNSIERQARLPSTSSVLPLPQWPPGESTSFGNSLSSYPTFGPRPLPPLNFYELPANHNGTPLILNDSRFPVMVNSSDRQRVTPLGFPVPEAGSGMTTPSLPPLILGRNPLQ